MACVIPIEEFDRRFAASLYGQDAPTFNQFFVPMSAPPRCFYCQQPREFHAPAPPGYPTPAYPTPAYPGAPGTLMHTPAPVTYAAPASTVFVTSAILPIGPGVAVMPTQLLPVPGKPNERMLDRSVSRCVAFIVVGIFLLIGVSLLASLSRSWYVGLAVLLFTLLFVVMLRDTKIIFDHERREVRVTRTRVFIPCWVTPEVTYEGNQIGVVRLQQTTHTDTHTRDDHHHHHRDTITTTTTTTTYNVVMDILERPGQPDTELALEQHQNAQDAAYAVQVWQAYLQLHIRR